MCLDCGCGIPNERHGDARHITYSDVVQAAGASGISPKKALKNMRKTLKGAKDEPTTTQAEHAWPASADPSGGKNKPKAPDAPA